MDEPVTSADRPARAGIGHLGWEKRGVAPITGARLPPPQAPEETHPGATRRP